MKQIFYPYYEWEDFKNGMYQVSVNEEQIIEDAVFLLRNEKLFFETAKDVLKYWVKSSDVNLSNKNINRQSWIGQSACCYKCKCNEKSTRIAWSRLSDEEKERANKVADKIILIYERKNRELYSGLGVKRLF